MRRLVKPGARRRIVDAELREALAFATRAVAR